MKDHAAFNKADLSRIYGEHPDCWLGSGKAQDWHHIFSRGERFGERRIASDGRKMFGSVLNAAPLGRLPHDRCPILHHPGMEMALYSLARLRVQNAVIAGDYEYTDNDREFMAFIDKRLQNPI